MGAQGTVLGGGRYDGLIEALGGPPTPAVGWAAGIERLAMLVDRDVYQAPFVAVIPMGVEAEATSSSVLSDIRKQGIAAITDFKGNMKKRMARADNAGVRYAIILGSDELEKGVVQMKSMRTGDQRTVPIAHIGDRVEAQRAADLYDYRKSTRRDDNGNPIAAVFDE
ncbi:MAG: His/Gly/Thr/Pro-type tRNA ligase C-terminal domain-containing protein [Parasphingopyxis sp.]